VTNGLLDDVPVDKVHTWEESFHRFMESNHPEIGEAIRGEPKKPMADELLAQLKTAISEFKETVAL
jgi:F-type H+/Na+-transporting ATPase subunit alpha